MRAEGLSTLGGMLVAKKADSFDGLPAIDRQHETFDWQRGDMAICLETVRDNFARPAG
jgi:hypothetical protein